MVTLVHGVVTLVHEVVTLVHGVVTLVHGVVTLVHAGVPHCYPDSWPGERAAKSSKERANSFFFLISPRSHPIPK